LFVYVYVSSRKLVKRKSLNQVYVWIEFMNGYSNWVYVGYINSIYVWFENLFSTYVILGYIRSSCNHLTSKLTFTNLCIHRKTWNHMKKKNVVELKTYKFTNLCNKVLMEDLQIQSFTVINDALTKFVRENALMQFIRKKAHEARTFFFLVTNRNRIQRWETVFKILYKGQI
jgi:hypothetical protein